MKKIISILLLTVTLARAAPLIAPDGIWHDQPPARIETEIGVATVSPAALVADFGWREPTAQEIADKAAARAEAEAQAAALEGLPEVFPNGIATVDADGHHVEHIPVGDSLPVLGIQVSNSPLTKEEKDARKAAGKATWEARKKEAKAAKSDKERIAIVMQALFGITEE